MQLSDLDATAAAELVRSGKASPRELIDGAIARIERHNAELGAVIVRSTRPRGAAPTTHSPARSAACRS